MFQKQPVSQKYQIIINMQIKGQNFKENQSTYSPSAGIFFLCSFSVHTNNVLKKQYYFQQTFCTP